MDDPNEKRAVNLTADEFKILLSLVSMERANELLDEMSVRAEVALAATVYHPAPGETELDDDAINDQWRAGLDDIGKLMDGEGLDFISAVERLCKERGLQ